MKNLMFLLIALLIISSACNNKEDVKNTLPKNAEAGEIYHIKTEKHEESGRLITTCIMAVHENHETQGTRIIDIPIKIFKSPNKNPKEAVFYLSGGPGSSNLTFWPPDELLAERDLVMIGYRGVDGSSKIDCPEFLKGTSENHLFSKESIKSMQNNINTCLDNWKQDGLDINCYTMTDVIDDMETARKALGYSKINLLSASYGTRLAQIYAYRYPESLYRSLMVSVNPPGHFVWQPETIDSQIEYYSELWAKDSVYSKKTKNLAATIKRVMNNMPKKWLFFDIDPDKVRFATFMGLYHTNSAGSVFDAFIAADNGDPSGLALVSLMTNWQLKNMGVVWGDMLAKSFIDYESDVDYASEMSLNSNILGSPGSQLFAIHKVWPVKSKDTIYTKVQNTDIETLMLSGNIDLSTPAEFATNELLPYLNNGKQHILKELGHTGDVIYNDYDAFIKAMMSFYDKGKADISGYEYQTVNFEPAMSFPNIAKISIAVIVFIVLLLVGIVLFIRRFIRRRKRRKLLAQS